MPDETPAAQIIESPSLDETADPSVCDCEFTPYEDLEEGEEEEPWHYLRRCAACGNKWYSLHCPHDGYQNCCPECGTRLRSWRKEVGATNVPT